MRLGYGEMTEKFRVPSDHLGSGIFAGISTVLKLALFPAARPILQSPCPDFPEFGKTIPALDGVWREWETDCETANRCD